MSLFTLGEPRRAEPTTRPGELGRGDYWSIVREGDDYLLCYLSDGLIGCEERLPLREAEARAILDGRARVEHFLLARSASARLAAPGS